MFEGFEYPLLPMVKICDFTTSRGIGLHYIDGSLENKLFNWPVFATITERI